tara:strand:+ start:22845 stop:23852 length:1008 start_codon:yes stop_codon:yes gene_type:complete
MSLLVSTDRIYVAGSSGMVGNSLCKTLENNGYNAINKKLLKTSRKIIDLRNLTQVDNWFNQNRPNIVIIAAAKVGGIFANKTYPVDFLLENLKIQTNLIETSWKYDVKRLLFLGSSCIYPKSSKQPIKEEYLLNDSLESTNQWYAIAKIAGLKLCEALKKQYQFDAISLMPTNLYGPKDNYDYKNSHVMASLIRKFYEAKMNNLDEVICWGSGRPLREFLFIDDFADACLDVLKYWEPNEYSAPKNEQGELINWLNVGSDFEISIKDLSEKISDIIGYQGKIKWDLTMPDGTLRKKLDNYYINKLGWRAKTNLDEGIKMTLDSFSTERKTNKIRF